MKELLSRAWNALDTFKQAYPENWHEEDEQVLKDLIREDLKLSGVKLKWVGLTDDEIDELSRSMVKGDKSVNWLCQAIEAKLKEKNT